MGLVLNSCFLVGEKGREKGVVMVSKLVTMMLLHGLGHELYAQPSP